jgi:hypothetical protein
MSDFVNFFKNEYEESFRAYSGRGMFGKQCVGITVASNQIGSTIFNIGLKIGEYEEGDVTDCSLEEFVQCFKNVKWDNMGLDYIIYFPDIDWDENGFDDEGEYEEETEED